MREKDPIEDSILLEKNNAVACLTLNRPQAKNAMNMEMLADLKECLLDVLEDESVRVLVITGSYFGFSAGPDLKELQSYVNERPGEPNCLDSANDIFKIVRNFPKPVVAALSGLTMGQGLELAMCADIIIAGESAKIYDAHVNYGVFPGAGGAAVLPRLVPLNMAMYLLLTGRGLSATEMKACGLVSEVHPDMELQEAAMKLAKVIAEKSPLALRRIKEVAHASADKSRDDAILHEQAMLRLHMGTEDFREGLKAFSEKRKPVFKGR